MRWTRVHRPEPGSLSLGSLGSYRFVASGHDRTYPAEFYNMCRRVGVQGSHTDFLISAVPASRGPAILTCDGDCIRYAKHVIATDPRLFRG